jgi:hypothetical protein
MATSIIVQMELTKSHLEDIIVTALEGGSNYWYQLGKMPTDLPSKGQPLAIRITEYVMNGGIIPIYDYEESPLWEDESEWTKLGEISRESISNGISKCTQNNASAIGNIMSEDYDAGDADIVFQYIVMGEIVFG